MKSMLIPTLLACVLAQPLATTAQTLSDPPPYRVPVLNFDQSKLFEALSSNLLFEAGEIMEGESEKKEFVDWEIRNTFVFLNDPRQYWHQCVNGYAEMAYELGGEPLQQGRANGRSLCKEKIKEKTQCLQKQTANAAARCLAQLIREEAENGD